MQEPYRKTRFVKKPWNLITMILLYYYTNNREIVVNYQTKWCYLF